MFGWRACRRRLRGWWRSRHPVIPTPVKPRLAARAGGSKLTRMTTELTIGRLAHAAGVHVETVRYYERTGLIVRPPKPAQGYRSYPSATIQRIRFIKRAQALGFTLQEISELLQIDDGECADMRERAERKLALVQAQIRDLSRLRDTLDALIRACHANGTPGHCPIVETLSDGGENPKT